MANDFISNIELDKCNSLINLIEDISILDDNEETILKHPVIMTSNN